VTDVEYQKVPFMINILEECLQEDDSINMGLLQEVGFHFFGKLMMKLNLQQLSEESIQKIVRLIQIVCKISLEIFDFIPLTVIILENCLLAEIEIINQVIGQNLSQFIPVWFTDLKETSLKYYFDMVEIYLRVDKKNRAEFSLHLLEQVELDTFILIFLKSYCLDIELHESRNGNKLGFVDWSFESPGSTHF